jgi:mRNA interferase MazF
MKKKEVVSLTVKRGDIYYADLSPVVGSEQGGLRPVLIVQNDIGNKYSPTVIAAAITSRLGKAKLPTHIDVYAERFGLVKDSVILLEQIRTIDKVRLKEKMGHLDEGTMSGVNEALFVSFGLSGQKSEPIHTPHRHDTVSPNISSAPPLVARADTPSLH